MRTQIIEQTIYSFSDLETNEQLKQKVLNKYSDINVDYGWWESTYTDAQDVGLEITGFDLDRNRHATGEFTLSANEVAQNILNEHGESCETYLTAFNFMQEWQPIFNDYMDENSENYESYDSEQKLNELEDEFLKAILEDYVTILQKECEYLTSEKSILETLKINEYEFNENGNII